MVYQYTHTNIRQIKQEKTFPTATKIEKKHILKKSPLALILLHSSEVDVFVRRATNSRIEFH